MPLFHAALAYPSRPVPQGSLFTKDFGYDRPPTLTHLQLGVTSSSSLPSLKDTIIALVTSSFPLHLCLLPPFK